MNDGVYAVSNLVSNNSAPVLSLASKWSGLTAELVINARVAIDPESLEHLVRNSVAEQAAVLGATIDIKTLQCFRPGKPVPTHRITT
jgi:hypothetical protein